MTDFYKKHKKKLIFVTFLFLLFFGGFWNLKYNLPKTVEVVVRLFLGPTFKSKSIDFEKDRIVIKDFILADGEEIIIDTPQVDILYSKNSLKNLRIEEIIVNGGIANITRRKNGDINIVAAFTGGSKEEKTEIKETVSKEYNPGISVPIDRITGKNVTTVFRDLGYRLPIEQIAYDTNGYLTFSKTEGIDLHFIGNNKKEIYDFSFSTAKEPYSMAIKLTDIDVKSELVQYGYDGKEVSYEGGKLNMDLTIASSGMLGWIKFNDVNVKYIDLDDTIKSVSGDVKFREDGIFLNAQGKVFDKPEKFTLSYKNNELNIDFSLKDIKQKDLEKLSYLNGVKLPFKNLNVDDVKFNLNLKKELKITIDTFIKREKIENLRLDNTKIKLIYDSKGIHLPIVQTTLNTLDKDGNISIQEKIDGKLDFDKGIGKLNLDIKNSNKKDYIPNFNGELNFKVLEEKIEFDLKSNIVNLVGDYLTKEEKIKLFKEKEYYLEYDLKNKKLADGEGKFDLKLLNLDLILNYQAKENRFLVNNFVLEDEGKKKLLIDGEYDLNNSSYYFNIKTDQLNIKRKFEDEFELNGNFKGKIEGEKEKFKGKFDIRSFSIKYLGEVEGLNGEINFDNLKNMFFEYQGEIGKLSYKEYSLNGVAVSMRLKDEIFQIRNFNNQLFTLNGEYNLKTSNIKGKLVTNNLPLERFNIEFPKIKLNKVVAEINGNISNPIATVKIDDIGIGFKNDQEVKINGNLIYKNNVLTTENVKINQSRLQGKYYSKTGKYSFKLNIIEDNIGRYYNYENLKYRVIGLLKVDGENKKIAVNLKTTVDKIYMAGKIFPTLYIEANYLADNLNDGVVKLKKAVFSNSKLDDLVTIVGEYDLVENSLDVSIDEQILELYKLKEYIPLKDIKGNLILKGNLSGKLEELKYNLSILSKNIKIKNIDFNDTKFLVTGDMDRLKLNEFSFKYLNNTFFSQGEYDIKLGKYGYQANTSQINLNFLNVFLEQYGITNVEGNVVFDIKLSDNTSRGFLEIKNLNLENKDFFLKLKKFNSTIRLDDNIISLKNFHGKLNDGDVDITGKVILPSVKEISENPYYYENIKYAGNLKLNDINYEYGDYFKLNFDTNIGISENKVQGLINIKKGEVNEIPNTSKSIFQKIKEFLFKSTSNTVNQSEDLGSDFKIESIIENAPVIDLQIKIDEGIKLDIGSVNAFVEDIKGNVIGNGILSGKNGKYTFLGNTEILGGSVDINDNTFYLERAIVIFNDTKAYLPKINPNLLVDARVNVQDEQIGLSLNGALDNLRFTISSQNGSSSGNLNALLTDSENLGDNNEATTTLITNVIGGQITQILKPVANLVKNTLNISKFRISSNLSTQESKNTGNNNGEKGKNSLKLGAVLEAEDNIYKDKIWWVAKGTLLEEDNTENNKRSDSSGAFQEYDFSLEYRFNANKSIGVGVGKLPENRKKTSDKESKENLNYHIDFKFEKKYDKLIDIFINK